MALPAGCLLFGRGGAGEQSEPGKHSGRTNAVMIKVLLRFSARPQLFPYSPAMTTAVLWPPNPAALTSTAASAGSGRAVSRTTSKSMAGSRLSRFRVGGTVLSWTEMAASA